jgi:hypothetical protein
VGMETNADSVDKRREKILFRNDKPGGLTHPTQSRFHLRLKERGFDDRVSRKWAATSPRIGGRLGGFGWSHVNSLQPE